jgi:probable F420-dependent oxidoreductase
MKSSLLYSYQVEYDDPHRTFVDSLEQIAVAESLGYEGVLISEHHLVANGYFPAPFVTMAAIAMKTQRMRVGSGVLLLPLYDPLHVAEHGSVLDHISGGRFTLGVGYGYRQEEFDAFGVSLDDRPWRIREGIEAIRALWTQPEANYQGEHFRYENVTLRPLPLQKPHPPIWMASKAPGAVAAAARLAEAWFADPITPVSVLKDRIVVYRKALAKQGKPTEGYEFPLMREVYCAETDDQAWEEARDGVLAAYREYLDWGHLLDDEGDPVPPGDDRALDTLRSRFIIGSPETCVREALRYRDELDCTEMVMRMKFPGVPAEGVMRSIRLWGERVMPEIG